MTTNLYVHLQYWDQPFVPTRWENILDIWAIFFKIFPIPSTSSVAQRGQQWLVTITMMLISRSLEIFTWVLWSTKVLDRGVNGDCTFSRWQATCCLQATTFRSSNLHILDRTVRPWELVQDQITFKRAYMQPIELSHKSQASVRWPLIYSYLQSSLRRPKLMRPNQVGLYIYLTAGIEYTP